jgi:D-threo-aldose 1-dehydrogenase
MDTFMLAGRYTLLEQEALDELLPLCEERGIRVVAAGVLNSGLLASSEPSRDARYDYAEAPEEVVGRARRIARLCEQHGVSLPAAAIAFPLAHPAVVSVCIGARSAAQVERNVDLHEHGVPPALWLALRERGLLRGDAPV